MGKQKVTVEDVEYFYSLAIAKNIRKQFLEKNPKFDYCRVFTERRKGGICRSKFWLTRDADMFIKWMRKNYPLIKVKYYPGGYYSRTGVAFFV